MFKKIGLCLMVVLCSLNLSGCIFLIIPAVIGIGAGVGIGIGTAKWLSDKLVEQVPHPYAQTIQAARDGVKDLKLDIIKETDTDKITEISCKYSDGRTVWVSVHHVSESVSRIEVRVGVWGGQPEARKILDAVLTHL